MGGRGGAQVIFREVFVPIRGAFTCTNTTLSRYFHILLFFFLSLIMYQSVKGTVASFVCFVQYQSKVCTLVF